MQVIYRAADITEAHIMVGMLRAEGIDAEAGGHYLQGGVGELGAMNFATVSVAAKDVDTGIALIREYEQAAKDPVRLSQKEGVRLSPYMYLPLIVLLIGLIIYGIVI
ncbi:putative signal transducing protein [Amphritea balenae]|uniref:DUF2007 domain-containing protein n=1 Tax=Amphritea balenae TaxID=452629 RepID=A0A3P1SU27_9GAMM|nr:DUF2007 domain-containing protein [Amphritea balenae]RRD00548.1 DUF2007 domain-containing protein [Amphritea balenae]GGK69820.1 hypothetical protein GCM10007941_20070 [Amphritea balenae]